MTEGDPVWYRQAQRGGYDCTWDVPGFFVRATDRRIVVRLLLKSGRSVNVAVHPKNVSPRDPHAVWKDE
jgi:hypothetical protein